MDAEKREKIVQEVMEFSLLKPGTNGYAVEESMLERLALRVERETLEEAAAWTDKSYGPGSFISKNLRRRAGEVK